MSEEKDMQSTDVELETDDLKEFVDMADVDDLDVSDGDDFFGDLEIFQILRNPGIVRDRSTISDAKKKKEENTTIKQTEEKCILCRMCRYGE